jgi:hypothetical protein
VPAGLLSGRHLNATPVFRAFKESENLFVLSPLSPVLEHVACGTVRKKLVENTDFHTSCANRPEYSTKMLVCASGQAQESSLSQTNPLLTSNVSSS